MQKSINHQIVIFQNSSGCCRIIPRSTASCLLSGSAFDLLFSFKVQKPARYVFYTPKNSQRPIICCFRRWRSPSWTRPFTLTRATSTDFWTTGSAPGWSLARVTKFIESRWCSSEIASLQGANGTRDANCWRLRSTTRWWRTSPTLCRAACRRLSSVLGSRVASSISCP